MKAGQIIQNAFIALSPNLVIKGPVESLSNGVIEIGFKNVFQVFNVLYEPAVSHAQIPYIEERVKASSGELKVRPLIVSKVIYPEIGKLLKAAGINFLDSLGNAYINADHFYIDQTGRRAGRETVEKKSRLFRDAGVRLIFGLLNHPDFIQLTYREMAAATGISLGSVNIIIKELIAAEYLEERTQGIKRIIRQADLLQRWAAAWQEVLKPAIKIGAYKFQNPEKLRHYRDIPVSDWKGLWGGEAAGGIYTKYLTPGKLTLFVAETTGKWLGELKLIPSESKPDIEVLQCFWDTDHPMFKTTRGVEHVVPPLLAYADLVTSTDIRNRETAQKIYDEYLQLK